jgi:hypothetical protein
MFVPGVNGSVIPSAPSGSRLKGAYKNSKNSKKRKMPNGGSTGFGMALEAATYVPGPVGTYASGASALANLYQGDYVGAGLDALNMATFGTAKGLMGVARAANAIRPYSNLAVNAAQASRTVNRVAKKVAPVTRAAGTVNQFTSSPYNATMRVPQRDNTQVQFRPNPNLRRMEEGGEVEDDDKEMVDGVASILRGVKSKTNRLQLANKLAKQFNREKVKYSLPSFMAKSNVSKYKSGGQHGGLGRWFAEKWVDVKSGKPCGRQEGESRAYPACRPSKRVSSKTPKTSSELSTAERNRFKSSKTSSQRISYNHKRRK